MRLIAHDEIPAAIGHLELLLQIFVAGKLVQAGDGKVGFHEPVACPGRFEFIVGQYLERQMEAPVQFILPLFGKTAGADDEAALQVAPGDQFLHQQTCHDCLAGTGIIGKQEPERLPGQHGFVNRGYLVWQWFNKGCVDGQNGIEQMSKADPVCFRDQAEKVPVSVEAPWSPELHDFKARFVVAV